MQTNVNPVVTPAQNTAIATAIATINTNLTGMVNLSVDQKMHGSKMGADTYDYCAKALVLMSQNPTLMPSWVNQPNSQSNMDTFNSLRNMKLLLHVLTQKIDDTMVQMGIQVKKSADDFYDNVKAASERGSVPGADGVALELAVFYSKSQTEQAEEATSVTV
jgi:hypothetical protein